MTEEHQTYLQLVATIARGSEPSVRAYSQTSLQTGHLHWHSLHTARCSFSRWIQICWAYLLRCPLWRVQRFLCRRSTTRRGKCLVSRGVPPFILLRATCLHLLSVLYFFKEKKKQLVVCHIIFSPITLWLDVIKLEGTFINFSASS